MSKEPGILSPEQFRARFPHAVPGAIAANLAQWNERSRLQGERFTDAAPRVTALPAAPKEHGAPRQRKPMNGVETAFFAKLLARKCAGEFERVDREGLSLRWPDGMVYSPDFIGWKPDGKIVAWEVKGAFIYRHGLEKFRAARAHWPWIEFQMHQRNRTGEWKRVL